MIITQISDSVTSPNTNETRTVSEFDTMNATSQMATSAITANTAMRFRSGPLDDCRAVLRS